jgi:hypothetical protein
MPKDDDMELDQLLARGSLSGRQYDQIERRVLEHAAPRPKRWLWPTLVPIAALASAYGAWLFVVGQGAEERIGSSPAAEQDAFQPKSGESPQAVPNAPVQRSPAAGVLSIGCAGAEPGVCRLGETLMFSVNGSSIAGYLGAYAEPVGGGTAARIWYFPSADGGAPRVEATSGTAVLARGVRLDPPHVPGQYQVTVWISEAPPERAPPGPLALARASLRLEIVP